MKRAFNILHKRNNKNNLVSIYFRKNIFHFSAMKEEDGMNEIVGSIDQAYHILNLSSSASIKEIYESYKRFAYFYNPNIYFEHDVHIFAY